MKAISSAAKVCITGSVCSLGFIIVPSIMTHRAHEHATKIASCAKNKRSKNVDQSRATEQEQIAMGIVEMLYSW